MNRQKKKKKQLFLMFSIINVIYEISIILNIDGKKCKADILLLWKAHYEFNR